MDAQPDDSRVVKLAVVEVLDRDGHARSVVPVWRWPVTIGRAIDCDIVLDDVHAAPRHATITEDDGVLSLVVGETVNGVGLKGRRLAALARVELPAGEVFEAGGTRLRIRRASDVLSPERPLAPEPAGGRLLVLALALALAAWNAASQWLNSDPGGRLTDYLPALLGVPLALAIWSGFWAVGSKLFRHRFDYWPHARIAFSYTLVASAIGLVLPVLAFAVGWAFPSRIAGIATTGVAWAMVAAHVGLLLPVRRRVLSAVMATLFVAGVSLFLIRNYQIHDRVFSELYVTTLAPPALRVAPTVAATRFIDEARGLKPVLDAHAKDDDPAARDTP
jgi:hypothetical protein